MLRFRYLKTRPGRAEKNIPEYNLLNYLKAEFVLNASLINPFNSTHFFWIDGGYGHGLPNIWPPHKGRRWPDPDKVRRVTCHMCHMSHVSHVTRVTCHMSLTLLLAGAALGATPCCRHHAGGRFRQTQKSHVTHHTHHAPHSPPSLTGGCI